MKSLLALLDEPDTTIAVVGAGDNPAKFGSRIYRDLKAKGYRVLAVNGHAPTVDGDPAYPTVGDLPSLPTIVDLVVPPQQTLAVLHQCHQLGLKTVWVQPGAEDDLVLNYLAENGFDFVAQDCIMVRARGHRRHQ